MGNGLKWRENWIIYFLTPFFPLPGISLKQALTLELANINSCFDNKDCQKLPSATALSLLLPRKPHTISTRVGNAVSVFADSFGYALSLHKT